MDLLGPDRVAGLFGGLGRLTFRASAVAFHHRSPASSAANLTWVEGLLVIAARSAPLFHQKSATVLDPPDIDLLLRRIKCATTKNIEIDAAVRWCWYLFEAASINIETELRCTAVHSGRGRISYEAL
jgi:hypothetical protein